MTSQRDETALRQRLAELERDNAALRAEIEGIASANVHAAMQLVELSEARARELEQKNGEIAAALREAEQASEQKSRFMANMSHELRTPLSGIIGLAELLADGELSSPQRDLVDAMTATAEGFLDLINQLLDLARIEAGRVELEQIEFDLWSLLENVAQLMQVNADHKAIDFAFVVDADVPRRVTGDPLRVRQVLLNLGTNAVKFTARGLVQLRAAVTTSGDRTGVQFQIDDTGCGFSADAATRLFQPFAQADAATTRHYGGTGLGLSISTQLVQRMRGTLAHASVVDAGSTFTVWLPLVATETDGKPARARRGAARLDTTRPATQEMLAAHLAHLGYDVVGPDAGGAIDLIVLEPATDGPAALQRLRRADPRTPVLLVSCPGGVLADDEFAAQGVIGMLQQPLRPTQIEALLADVPLAAPAATAGGEFIGMRVLVAEDTEINRRVIAAQLQRLGCSVTTVENGRDAVTWFRREAFDLVLLDCQMPVLDGYGAATAIRRAEAEVGRGRTPVVALTANALPGDRDRGLAAGMDEYCTKPLRTAQLRDLLSRWWLRRPAGPAPAVDQSNPGTSARPFDATAPSALTPLPGRSNDAACR